MAYKPLPVETTGGQKHVRTADDDMRDILKQILVEIRIMNTQLSMITGTDLRET